MNKDLARWGLQRLETLVQAQLEPYQYKLVDPFIKEGMMARGREGGWDRSTQEIVTMILAGLAKQAGGSLVLTEADLAEKGDQIYLDINERAGLVTVVLIPEYVAIGKEEEAKTLHGKDGAIYVEGKQVATTSSATFTTTGGWVEIE